MNKVLRYLSKISEDLGLIRISWLFAGKALKREAKKARTL